MILWFEAPVGFPENELKLNFSMWEENASKSKGKSRNLLILGIEAPGGIAKSKLNLGLSIGEENARKSK